MRFTTSPRLPEKISIALVVGDVKELKSHPLLKELPSKDQELVATFAKTASFAKPKPHWLLLPSGRKMLVLTKGSEPSSHPWRAAILAMRHVVFASKKERVFDLAVALQDFVVGGMRPSEVAEAMATQFHLANFQFVAYKTPDPEGWPFVRSVHFWTKNAAEKGVAGALTRGDALGEEINAARVLANTPGGNMTPSLLAEAAIDSGKRWGFKVKVLHEKEIARLGMGGLLGVAQGSQSPPRFIIMEYLKGPKTEKPVVLVGKGITFDTGGLNIKPEDHMYEMHMDMTGGAAVLHVIATLARWKVKKNVVALIPAAENMVSGSSYRPGDLLRTMSGKTIEVLNTDAEGRIVLADGLTYAQRYSPRLVVDVATLTGAAMVALGQRASAIFTTDRRLEDLFRTFGEVTGDYVWPLPLWEEFEKEVEGTFGDVANLGKYGRLGGAVTAATFLWQFIKEYPWVHVDIAPRMTPAEDEFLAKGSAGPAVNLLAHLLETF